ncbi:sensor domain-containing diguanylate cyclase, partial [Trichloromonas sp.]|uniref:sensor domain-containing diguanylate cyclase n=1 Tax=Trichloromonas sp. TaxID=3069249 RepID=UPI003D81BB70
LHPRELMLLEMLCTRFAAKSVEIDRAEEHRREHLFAQRLVSMIGALSVLDDRTLLYRNLVEMAADLLEASCASLMLLDDSGENLRIQYALGMQEPLAHSIRVPLGSGIAGRVAKTGFPLLVTDIEKDQRTAIHNRPRFRTKSFISVPLKIKEQTIGVLNLTDKINSCCFNESEINLVTSLTTQASLMFDRITSLEQARKLEKLAITDPLTGLYNRRFLERRLEEELSRSGRQNLSFTVMLIDLDHFKNYNDSCGHIAGDHALRQVATLLRTMAREMDVVTRYGGEEFFIILPGTSTKEAWAAAERIRRAIAQEPFSGEEKLPNGKLTASIGIASFPATGRTAATLIHTADIALYRAKNQGRNQVVIFEQGTPQKVAFI